MSNASVPAGATDLTFATAVQIGSVTRKMNGLAVYQDPTQSTENEAVWVFKTDRPWIVPVSGNPFPLALPEMEAMRSQKNGVNAILHSVYLYFPLGNGLERYYNANIDDMGPNLGEGLPSNRNGPIVSMVGYPGRFFALMDGGANGYSSVMVWDNNGWYEKYRARSDAD